MYIEFDELKIKNSGIIKKKGCYKIKYSKHKQN